MHNHNFIEDKNYICNDIREFLIKKVCTKCFLCVAKRRYESAVDYFFFNGVEVYNDFINLDKLNLTCDEVIIKNILE
jgi:hypothetical protein